MKNISQIILDSEKRTLDIDGDFYFVTEPIYQFFMSNSDKRMLGVIFNLGLNCGDITLVK